MMTGAEQTMLLYAGLSDAEERRLMALDGEVARELFNSWRTYRCVWGSGAQHGSRVLQLQGMEGVLFTIPADEFASVSNAELLSRLRASLNALN